jgi:uncharacterized protein (DUF2062 family)
VRDPLLALLKQGATPDGLARTLGVGVVCSLFPFLGTTSLLNLVVGQALRLNHALLQTLNQILAVPHLIMVLVYVRGGELIWGATENRFTVTEMLRAFRELGFGEFLQRFGWAGVHAFTAWALTAPLLYYVIYRASRPALRRLSRYLPSAPVSS